MVTSWHPDPQKTTWINPAAAELAMTYLCTACVDIPALGGVKKPKWPIIWPIGHVDADIRINFRIIRQYRAISDIRIAKNICIAIPNPNIHTIGHMTWENPKWTTYPHEAVAKLSDIHGGYYCAGDFAGSLSIRGLTRALCREALSGAGRWKADLGKGLSSRILFWNQVRLVQKNFLWL